MPIDPAVEVVLNEYEERSEREARRWASLPQEQFLEERDQYLLAVGAATGSFINLLVKEMKARVILEIGTSYGYSTLWLAEAARAAGGRIITLELQAAKQDFARSQLARTGLDGFVDFRSGDALDLLRNLETSVDFVLLDLWKNLYIPCFDLFYPKLNPGALVVADNMLYPESAHPHAMKYREHARAAAGIQSMLLPVGQGIEVSRLVRGVDPVAV
ncbi:MAG TPA: class I SAM-dependent methyltransferase [Terriglobia bacterium]|nr:class I SAM-dependent methyltransferase [Terriglobia bacterium]